ncbi:MAG: hypothetical protein HWD62_19705 [Cyclobacteriaceae bacterium]|nr:MAG: hypothetical protein HWD62_19705 [Cyclobacteriaceae bacterium]
MNEYHLLVGLNHLFLDKITIKIITQLRKLKGDHLLSGDSGLKNVWEEICAQVQGGDSYYHHEYQETANNFIKEELEKQPNSVIELICYLGSISHSEIAKVDDRPTIDHGVAELSDALWEKAGSYSNFSIRKYLDDVEG